MLPKEKTGIELAKEEAERRAKEQENMEPLSPESKKKNKKKVGFANTSTSAMPGMRMTEEVKMRNRPILSDEHEQTQKFSSAMS